MKNFSFIALLATSIAFLACTDDGDIITPSLDTVSDNCKEVVKSKVAAKGFEKSFEGFEGYKGLEGLDPSCKNEEKNFVLINDTNTINPPDLDKRIYECQEGATTFEEVYACKDEAMKYWDDWRDEHKKRDLPIPCVAVEGVTMWGAWLTDEEIKDLVETYGVSYDDGNYELTVDVDVPPPGGNGGDRSVPDGCGSH
ncbi:MAG: hypothetical protein LBC64_11455 [Fibromonadaceae bacterium]|jgi:hypothetical protein|nr:hypothetical protein [Fibromonadaceae bacterium]